MLADVQIAVQKLDASVDNHTGRKACGMFEIEFMALTSHDDDFNRRRIFR